MDDMNEELSNALKVVLADHYATYFKAQGYHWNVEGADFQEYHSLFGSIYDDVYGAIDMLAENIRKLQSYAPFKMSRFLELSTVGESEVGSDPRTMVADLLTAIESLIASNAMAFAIANSSPMTSGIANDLAGRDGMLQKWAWQLRSSLK